MSVHWVPWEIQAKNTTPDKADVRMKAWLEFVGRQLKTRLWQDYDRDQEALRKDGRVCWRPTWKLARYRDKGGKLSAARVAGA